MIACIIVLHFDALLYCTNYAAQIQCGTYSATVVQIALDDVSLDDMWTLDLNKLDGWHCVKENTTGDVKESLTSDEGSDQGSASSDSDTDK